MMFRIIPVLLSVASLGAFDGAAASLTVSGGMFTWNSALTLTGSGWSPGESIAIVLRGPLNSPGVDSADLPLGAFTADAQGNLSASPTIPYDSGVVGVSARIPRPGFYEVDALGTAAAADYFNLAPDTYAPASAPFSWGHERGGREGVLPGSYKQFSPERFDPEWPTVWDERPVEVYGTIPPGETSLISPSDAPPTHYAHDAIFYLTPDGPYQWLTGTANYYVGDPEEIGRLEVEWETLSAGNVATYGQGNIGLPLWASPTAGDRAYVVGRWILDAGHPELGDRTEIHPPRLLATMRQRPALASNGAAAAQVDVYVSGHGGGANRMPAGLSDLLNQGGYGGGRIKDVLSAKDQEKYYQAGPLSSFLSILVDAFLKGLTGDGFTSPVFPDAGPSAFPWGSPGPEAHAVNDMDYDFDVPLPGAPDGATSVVMDVTDHPQHSTAVTEVVTYTNPVNGLPTTAHIHLPYNGADNGIYARSLKFSWDAAMPPVTHMVVRLKQINVKDTDGKWQLWSDVSGQWNYLSGNTPGLFKTKAGQSVALPDNPADVYLGSGDTLRIFVQGYRAACDDDFFGKLFGQSSYSAGLAFLQECGASNNDDLGGAVLELQPGASGNYTAAAVDSSGASHFSVDLTVDSVAGLMQSARSN
jgi:hypothetical protein